jgi:uncharacterized repeat protein (TIGR03803 family)
MHLWDSRCRERKTERRAGAPLHRAHASGNYRLTIAEGLEQRIVLSSYPLHFDDSFLPYPGGASPFGLAADSAGDVFGVFSAGGPGGPPAIFEMAHGTSSATTLATFSSAYDTDVNNLVVDPGGDLFGTTSGTTPTVFEVAHGSGSIKTLAPFNNATGTYPNSRLTLDANGDLFGTTYEGGTGGAGTVFELLHGTSTLTALASFNGTNGQFPNNVAVDSAGDVFGTVQYQVISGVNNNGAVFEVAQGTGTITTVATFNGTDGKNPQGGVALDSKGDLFGTASGGGSDNQGDVFEVPHGTTAIAQIAPFSGANGSAPSGDVVVDAAGDVFGTTDEGGSSTAAAGTAFDVVSGSGVVTALGSFGGSFGNSPNGIALDTAGDFFGATGAGGPSPSSAGEIFEAPHGTAALTTAFNSANGSSPQAIVADAAGDLFGTTADDGPNASGTVFEISHATGTLTTLASFSIDNGEDPDYLYGNPYYGSYPDVALDSAGDVYGVANTGGSIGAGSIFEVVHNSGTITTLASFNATNGDAPVGIALDPAGDVFGVTAYGGNNSTGTVFELPHGSSTIATLASFSSTDAGLPGGLVLDAAGDLFGTATDGGNGFVFEVAHNSGAINAVASFNGANGSGPQGVTADAAGDLFGTTGSGGNSGNGTVFEVAHGSGAITGLASFDGVYQQIPLGAVSIDASGDVFGDTAEGGGSNDDGTVFEVAHNSGAVTTLLSFSGSNGQSPAFGIVSDSSNDLYGIAGAGGAAGSGAAFELSPVAATELAFANQPVNTVIGATLNPPVTIDLEDSASNLATTNNSTVMLAIKSGPAGASLAGTATAVAANGIATFSNLSLATPGAYTFIATDGSLASATSVSFTVASAPAAVVIVNGNGQTASAGNPFPVPLSVQVTDSLGDPVPGVAVTFSAPDGTPGASGTFAGASGDGTSIVVQTNTSGVASSPTLICNTVPGSFNVNAAVGSFSANFALNNTPGTAAQLAFGQQPTTSGSNLPAVTVDVQDAFGNLVTTDTSTVALAITSGPTGASLGGTASIAAAGGVATFPNLVLSTLGTYTLTATDTTEGAVNSVASAPITIVISSPTVVSVTPEDSAGNGVAAGSAAKGQRSMETQMAVVFSQPVNLATGAFSLGLVNNYGSGANNGAADTSLTGVLGTPANPSGDGVTWIIPIHSNGTNSYALNGTHGGISGASLNNGIYQLNVVASDVTAATGGTAMASNYTSAAWHRLFGDIDNARRVFNTEYSAFLAAFTSTYESNGATNYNQDLDYDGDGRAFNADYAAFLADFGSTKIYSEPQS